MAKKLSNVVLTLTMQPTTSRYGAYYHTPKIVCKTLRYVANYNIPKQGRKRGFLVLI